MLLILPILLIILILVILFFVPHNSIYNMIRPMSNVTINNWARLVPPIIRLWWNEVKVYFVWDRTILMIKLQIL